ncbi:hypothetical protein BUALT_Bualt10G0056100 [Buddleja alternifolia]|uniref:WRKY domain-containing protein n=1 Tax=Buddleja alternifolia TaxID=168488 RepID=A0AAV6X128_9LAMI|nr:hypothetical protein BUALT_Bualt10G0056100 [Buddleja alternifolia]
MEDWSLQAIVRGTSADYTKIVDVEKDGQDWFFDLSGTDHEKKFDQEFLDSNFPGIFDVSIGSGDELEELYKPFYGVSPSLAAQTVLDFQEQLPGNVDEVHKKADHESDHSLETRVYAPKYKRRKNQQKRVVIQVSADGLACDMWAWRKYGQKPIKGSPYPRFSFSLSLIKSYYRCSSSKGCLARKQVEQSYTDPGMYILTYTAEHSHSQPTRRNSLAGTVRQKFPSPKSPPISKLTVKQEKSTEEELSPIKTLLQVSSSTEVVEIIKHENKSEELAVGSGEMSHDDHENDFIMSDNFKLNEDFFSGLEDFDEFISGLPMCSHTSAQQFPVRSCS